MIKEMHETLTDYTKWLNVNSEKNFTLYDYIHGVFQSKNLHPDLAIAFLKLLWPDFIIKDEFVFLKEEFTYNRYQEIISTVSETAEIEYWINLLNIDEVINSDSTETSSFFAVKLSDLWKKKLIIDFPNKRFEVKVIYDEGDSGSEVYITFQQS
ncbi:MAG: hypothetical protein F6K00_02440 [Leptolyngbya sp. SIOISBB]|nr:hypothetical protein [Leptolyngbya sp. SIOISBB]